MMASEELSTNTTSGTADVRRAGDMLFMQVVAHSPVGWDSGSRTSGAKAPVQRPAAKNPGIRGRPETFEPGTEGRATPEKRQRPLFPHVGPGARPWAIVGA